VYKSPPKTHHIPIKHSYRCKGYLFFIKCYQVKITLQTLLFTKKTRFMGYKYIMRPSKQRFIAFILYCIYIFRASLSRIFLYFFSPKRYLFKHRRVLTSTKKDFLHVPITNHLNLPSTKYKLPWLTKIIDKITMTN